MEPTVPFICVTGFNIMLFYNLNMNSEFLGNKWHRYRILYTCLDANHAKLRRNKD